MTKNIIKLYQDLKNDLDFHQKTYYLLLVIISAGIGIQSIIYKIALILLFIQWVFSGSIFSKINTLRTNQYSLGCVGFYFLYMLSIGWSDNFSFGVADLVLKSPIFILPLVISTSRYDINKKQLNTIFLVFVFSILTMNLYAFFQGLVNYFSTSDINALFYSRLTINMHSAYQSMFTTFSIVATIYLNLRSKVMSNKATYIIVALQIIFILLLSSRMQILLMIILIPSYFIIRYYKVKQLWKGILYSILIFYAGERFMNLPSALKYRYAETVTQINNIKIGAGKADPRKEIWKNGVNLIQENFVFGCGIGDAKQDLQQEYLTNVLSITSSSIDSMKQIIRSNEKAVNYISKLAKTNNILYEEQLRKYVEHILKATNIQYDSMIRKQYNFHNQYLQTFATVGIFGFILLLYLLISPFIRSVKRIDYFSVIFLFILGASFLTESMLERQAGVIFFAFFYSLIAILKVKDLNKPS